MAMCFVCRRNILIGERYRLWTQPRAAGERPVCRLCEHEAEEFGWTRLDLPLQRELGNVIRHARLVA
jgi:hypothetical protein